MRLLPASIVTLAGALAVACGSELAQLEIRPQGTPRFVPFVAHDVLAGYQLDLTVAIRETRGVDVALALVSVGAIDLPTRQAFLTYTLRAGELQELGLQTVAGGSAVTFDPSLGLVAVLPGGPVELTLAVEGTDADGNAVSDFQVLALEVAPP